MTDRARHAHSRRREIAAGGSLPTSRLFEFPRSSSASGYPRPLIPQCRQGFAVRPVLRVHVAFLRRHPRR